MTPNFVEMDDRSAARLCDEVMEALAEGIAPEAVDALAEHYTGDDLMSLIRGISKERDNFDPSAKEADIWHWHELPEGFDDDALLSEAFAEPPAEIIGQLMQVLEKSGGVTDSKNLDLLRGRDWSAPGLDELEALSRMMLWSATAKSPFSAKIGAFPTKASRTALGEEDLESLERLMGRIEIARERQKLLWSARKSLALHRFAGAFLAGIQGAKAAERLA